MQEEIEIRTLKSLVSSLMNTLDLLKAKDRAILIKASWQESKQVINPEFQQATGKVIETQVGDECIWAKVVELTRDAFKPYDPKLTAWAIIAEILERNGLNFQALSSGKANYSTSGSLSIALDKISRVWRYLVKLELYSVDSHVSKAVTRLSCLDLNKAATRSIFLSFVLGVQRCFTAHDIMRLIDDLDVLDSQSNEPESGQQFIVATETLHPELQSYLSQYHVEMIEKFNIFSTKKKSSMDQNVMKICDFTTLLKIVFQDCSLFKLVLASDDSRTCIFKSVSAAKNITMEIYRYFEEVLRVDRSLEANSNNNLKMNFEVFLSILNHLLNSGILMWTRDDQQEGNLEGEDKETAPELKPILDFGLHTKIKRVIESESQLSYKLIGFLTDLEIMLHQKLEDNERSVIDELLKHMSLQLATLKSYRNNFSSSKDHFKTIEAKRRRLEKVYYSMTTNSIFSHYNMKNQIIDLEKYLRLMDAMGVSKLLPNFTKKNFVVYYIVEASGHGQLNFEGFLKVLESVANKILERHPVYCFASLLDQLIANFERDSTKWKLMDSLQISHIKNAIQDKDKLNERIRNPLKAKRSLKISKVPNKEEYTSRSLLYSQIM